MDSGSNRVAQVFIWKQGAIPDLEYARQVLSVVNPEARKAISGDNPPLQLFSVLGPWPDDPWVRALQDIRAIPAPDGVRWTDPNRYDLSGWQGTDSRTGDKIFVVTAFLRPGALPAGTFKGEGVQAPPYTSAPPVAQVPYYPQYPTGPLVWPSQPQSQPQYVYPPYSGATPQYPYGYNPMITGPLAGTGGALQVMPEASQAQPAYASFYVGFGERFAALLMDFFFLSFFEVPAILGLAWAVSRNSQPADFTGVVGLYGPFGCIAIGIFVAYFVIGWSTSGHTIGKRLMSIKVVAADGTAPTVGRSLLRILGYFFSFIILCWGFIMVALDSRRQGLHDKIAETYVVPDNPAGPVPTGTPGYRMAAGALPQPAAGPLAGGPGMQAPATAMPVVAGSPPYGVVQVAPPREQTPQGRASETPPSQAATGPLYPGARRSTDREQETPPVARPPGQIEPGEGGRPPSGPLSPFDPDTDVMLAQTVRERQERSAEGEQARILFKEGIAALENGVRRGYTAMEIDPNSAREAATQFQAALQLVPSAVAYRYFHAVALRYSEGFEAAISDFRQVLELDPGHYESQQQVALGPRWHDAFAYPAWGEPAPVAPGMPLVEPVRLLLPQPHRPGTRLVLLREGSNKMVVALSRTRRDTWAALPTPDMPARIELVLTRTPSGPIIAFYVVIRDDPENPYKGETFLNPHDPGQPSDDACQLGQHMLAQLARQDHSYLIFVDEKDNLLLSRRLVFDAATQVNIARVHYEVQSLPPQVMDATRFQQAAQWHMENFSLDQIRP